MAARSHILSLLALLACAAADPQPASLMVRVYDTTGNRTFLYVSSNAYYSQDAPVMTLLGLPIRYIDQPVLSPTPQCPSSSRAGYGPTTLRRNGWVALSFSCGFSFADRSVTASQLGAAAIIVVDPTTDANQNPATGGGSITSISVGNTTGREIYENMARCGATFGLNDTTCNSYIDIRPPSFSSSLPTLVPQAFAFALIMFFCAMCCCLFVRRNTICACFCRRSRFDPMMGVDDPTLLRMFEMQHQASQRQLDSTTAAVAALPFEELSPMRAEELAARQDACAVCLDGFESSTLIRTLSCQHVYHKDCIDPWLIEHGTCPLCKACIVEVATNDPTQAPLTEQQLYMLLLHLHLQRRRRRSRAPPEVADYLQTLAAMARGQPHLLAGQPVPPPWPHEETAFAIAANTNGAAGPAINSTYDHETDDDDDEDDYEEGDSSEGEHSPPTPIPTPPPAPVPALATVRHSQTAFAVAPTLHDSVVIEVREAPSAIENARVNSVSGDDDAGPDRSSRNSATVVASTDGGEERGGAERDVNAAGNVWVDMSSAGQESRL